MAVNTISLLTLKKYLWQSMGDYRTFATTTNIGAGTTVISTTLRQHDNGRDGAFDDWWIYIDGTANAGEARKTGNTTYATATGTLTVYGANLSAETGSVTCYLTRYEPAKIERAILRANEEIYPTLHLKLDDTTLVAGNILPDGSFEDWSSSSALQWYSTSSITLAKTATNALFRHGLYSAKATAGAANGYFYISSDTYPRLLDLQGQTVNFYCLAYPEVADDAAIVIYTVQPDGTAQTLTSSTANPAGAWTILKLENQTLNDDLEEIQIRFKVATNAKYAYFDDAVLFGRSIKEYLLPVDFRNGHVSLVTEQRGTSQAPPCYDYNTFATMSRGRPLRFDIVDEGNWRYLRLLENHLDKRRLRLTGFKPLETLSTDAGTVTLDAERVPLLIEYAKLIFMEREGKPVSSGDISRFNFEFSRAYQRYQSLFYKLRMNRTAEYL